MFVHKQLVQETSTSATWVCVYLCLPGVMVTWIVLMVVTSYLDVTAVSCGLQSTDVIG